MTRIRTAPSLGGWLAIANSVTWVFLAALNNIYHGPSPEWMETSLGAIGLLLSLPLAFPFLLPDLDHYHGPTYQGQVMIAILIGGNSFLWGYGIEYALRWARLIKPRQPLIPPID